MRVLVLIGLGLFGGAASNAQGQVWTVDDNGGATVDFQAIQPAIDAASDGDLVLVRPGAYSAFTIDGKSVVVTADEAGPIGIETGTIVIRNLAAGKTAGLRGAAPSGFSFVDILVQDNAGHVWLEDCGTDPTDPTIDPWTVRAEVTSSASVTFVRCTFKGPPSPQLGDPGLLVTDSSVRLYGTRCIGFQGTDGDAGFPGVPATPGGRGGAGLLAVDSLVITSGGDLVGGAGGSIQDFFGVWSCAKPGDGGPAAELVGPTTKLWYQDTILTPGPAGMPAELCGPMGAQPGVPILIEGGAAAVPLGGSAHLLQAGAPAYVGGVLGVDVHGDPGEHVFAVYSLGVGGLLLPILGGALMTAPPWFLAFLGILPASGGLHVDVPIGGLGGGVEGLALVLQGAFVHPSTMGPDYLGSPTLAPIMQQQPPFCCATYRVDDDAPADPGPGDPAVSDPLEDGSSAHPFDSIQEGLDVATHGDTVQLAAGIFRGAGNRDLDFAGKAIDLLGSGAASSVIDCELAGRAIHFQVDAPQSFRLEGITFRNGLASRGGALYVQADGCAISDCVFDSNTANEGGGAIFASGATPTIDRCTFVGNVSRSQGASGYGGGAIAAAGLTVTDSVFDSNVAEWLGYGGAYLETGAFSTIRGCTMRGNSALRGGAIYASVTTIERTIVVDNSAQWVGGGIEAEGQHVTVRDCWVVGNQAVNGAGIYSEDRIHLYNSTIADNSASGEAGGLFVLDLNVPTPIVNSVFWGNTAPSGAQVLLSSSSTVKKIEISYSDMQGGLSGIVGATVTWGPGNIDADPLFGNPMSVDYHLTQFSPCINAGDPSYILVPGELDIDGEPRVQPPALDMGADEVRP